MSSVRESYRPGGNMENSYQAFAITMSQHKRMMIFFFFHGLITQAALWAHSAEVQGLIPVPAYNILHHMLANTTHGLT